MIGSILVSNDIQATGCSYSVFVNDLVNPKYKGYKVINNLYTAKANPGDVCKIIFDTPGFSKEITIIRRDYTVDEEAGNQGIYDTIIYQDNYNDYFTYTFTATTLDTSYDFEYRIITGNFDAGCFYLNDGAGFNNVSYDIKLYNHKLLVTGFFTQYKGVNCGNIIRIDYDGQKDTTFTGQTFTAPLITYVPLEVLNNGKSLIADFQTVRKFNIDGTTDLSWNTPTVLRPVLDIEVQSDGKIMIGGNFRNINGNTNYQIIGRLNSDGTTDTSWAITNNLITTGIGFYDIDIQSDGKVLAIGPGVNLYSGVSISGITRFNSNGTIDSSFNPVLNLTGNTIGDFHSRIKALSNGKILVGGVQLLYNGNYYSLVRLNSDGSWDSTFNFFPGLINLDTVRCYDFYVLSDNKILFNYEVGGPSSSANYIIRLNEDGSIDNTFNTILVNPIIPGGNTENMAVDESYNRLYVVGNITSISGQTFSSRNVLNIAAFDLDGNSVICDEPTPTPTPTVTPTNTPTPSNTPVTPSPTATPTVTPTNTPTPSSAGSYTVYVSTIRSVCEDFCNGISLYLITVTKTATNDYANMAIGDTISGLGGTSGYIAFSDVSTDTNTGPFKIANVDTAGEITALYTCSGGACAAI